MINDTTHNFNPEHFDEGLYQEFRRSNYFNYTKFLEDRALEVEQARFNEQVARERVEELKLEVDRLTDELDETKWNLKFTNEILG